MNNQSTATIEPIREQQAQQKRAEIRTEVHSVSSKERAAQRRPVGSVLIILTVCLLLGSVLFLNARRVSLSYEIISVQNELTEAQSLYVTMQNQLDKAANEQGRDAASIGMQEAKLSQLRYIDLTSGNKIEVISEMSLWDKIIAFFDGLFQ